MKINFIFLSMLFLSLLIFESCTGSKSVIYDSNTYEILNIESITFSDYVFYELRNTGNDSSIYAISTKIVKKDSLKSHFKKVKIGNSYSLTLTKLKFPFVLKSRGMSFYENNKGRIWENDTMKVDLYFIENVKEQYLISK